MRQKRFLLWLLIVCVLLSALPVTAGASGDVVQQIIDSCTYDETIDISQFYLTESELETLFYGLLYEGKLPWYTANTYTYYYNESTGYMLEFEPTLLDRARYDRMLYEQRIAEVLDACVLEGMEKWQIALAIHDYLILNCVYDESLKLDTGYDLLVSGSTVCSGYAAVYQDLMLRAGIPCLQVDSEPMEHVWNLVQLDGQWYHVDVTWDDPTPDTSGLVSHEYFLRTDAQMSAGEDPHYDWETDITCTDTRYTDAFWTDVPSSIVFTDSNTCFYIGEEECVNSVYCRNILSGEETCLYREKENYVDIGYGEYMYSHTGLSLWNDRLWFCTMDQVLSMNTSGKDLRTEYTYKPSSNGRVLAGCHVANDVLELSAADHDGNSEPTVYALPASGAHVHSYTQTVTEPSCGVRGYTTSVCQCGLTAKGDWTASGEHDLQRTDYKAASFFSGGYSESYCKECGETVSEVLPRIDFAQWISEHRTLAVAVIAALIGGISAAVRKRKSA